MNTERKRQFVSAPDAHTHHGSLANLPSTVARLRDTEKSRSYLVCDLQSQLFPQLHALLSFMGQFLPLFLQFGLSAAKETVHIAATRIENRIFV
jgi:hypothetical protein